MMHIFKLVLAATLVVGVFADGEVIIVSQPPAVEFHGHEECDSNIVKDICSTSLGFTTYQTGEWSGMYIKNPFGFAQSVVVVALHGVSSLDIKGHKFPFISKFEDMPAFLESKILERYPYGENQSLVEINLDDDMKAVEINLNKGKLHMKKPNVLFLKKQEEIDNDFLKQVALLEAILDKVKGEDGHDDGLPDLYWFNLKGLHPIIDIYGENSSTGKEAKGLVASSLQKMKKIFDEAYQFKTLLLVISSDTAHTRRFRRATNELDVDRKLAPVYDENYPVFFNIFLWFTIAFIMTIIATSMVTACMDPGRDSIIYRMTSTRMKKDN